MRKYHKVLPNSSKKEKSNHNVPIFSPQSGVEKSRIRDIATALAQAISGEFNHYEEVPASVAELIKEGKK